MVVGNETGVGYISRTQNSGSTRKRTGLQYSRSANELIAFDFEDLKSQTSVIARYNSVDGTFPRMHLN